jgi:hypothetical protein
MHSLAARIVAEAVTHGVICGRRCNLSVIAGDILDDLRRVNWWLYILSLDETVDEDTWWVSRREDYAADIEDQILGHFVVMDSDIIRYERLDNVLTHYRFKQLIRDFVTTHATLLKKF